MVYITCLFIGILAALTGSIIGLGGGIILVPSLLFLYYYSAKFFWATPQVVVGISLLVMVFTALSSTFSYWKKGRVDSKTGFLFLIGSIPGGVLGSLLNQFINTEQFSIFFGSLILVLSLFMLFYRNTKTSTKSEEYQHGNRTVIIQGKTYHYQVQVFKAISIAFCVGILSGLFGIGGGLIMVPTMILLFRMPAHIATGTSMFMILFLSLSSSSTHIFLGHIAWEYVLIFIPGAWIGGTLGAKLNQMLKSETIEWILRIVLVMMGLRLIFEGLS